MECLRIIGKSKIKFPTIDANGDEKWDDEDDHEEEAETIYYTSATHFSKLGNLFSSVRSARDVALITTACGMPSQEHDLLPVIGTSDFPNNHLLHQFVLQLILTPTFDI